MATKDEALEAFISTQLEKAKKRMQERLDELVKLEEEGKLPVYGMPHLTTILTMSMLLFTCVRASTFICLYDISQVTRFP